MSPVTFTVLPTPAFLFAKFPVAVATVSNTAGRAPLTVTFTGDQSTDPENSALTYVWNFGDGSPISAVANPSHTYTAPGSYIATLTVTDGGGGTNTAAADTVVVVGTSRRNAVCAEAEASDGATGPTSSSEGVCVIPG